MEYNAAYLTNPLAALGQGLTASENSVEFIALGDAPDGDHTLATITFEVVEAKASSISLTDVLVSGAGGTGLESTTADGMVTAPAAESPSGR